MSTISFRLPDTIHKRIKQLSKMEGVSINQFISFALAEKVSIMITAKYHEKRAKLVVRKRFKAVLSRASNKRPEPFNVSED